MSEVERRKYPRFPFNVNVKYEVLNPPTLTVAEAMAKNISFGGISLVVHEKFNIGTLLKLKLSRPGEDKTLFILKGKVIWIEEFSSASSIEFYDCGIEFIDVILEDQKNIISYLTSPSTPVKSDSFKIWKAD
jgi:c-di-GMP-binding flagellar brake protein YcgR